MQDSEKMSPDEIRMVRDLASFVARRHNGEYEIWQKKGLSLLEKNGWKKEADEGAADPALIYRIRRRAPGFSHGDIRRTFSCSQLMPRYSSASSHNTLSGLSRSTFVL